MRKGLAAGVLALGIAAIAPFASNVNAADIKATPDTLANVLKTAQNNDIVTLASGEYKGSYGIPAGVTVKGESRDGVLVTRFNVSSDKVTITNLTMAGENDSAIAVSGKASNLHVSEVTFKDAYNRAINGYVEDLGKTEITGNKFNGVTYGSGDNHDIYLVAKKSTSVVVSGNQFKGVVQVRGVNGDNRVSGVVYDRNNWFKENYPSGEGTSLMIMYNKDTKITNNTFDVEKKSGAVIALQGGNSNITIDTNEVDGGSQGISTNTSSWATDGAVSDNIVISNNTISNQVLAGIVANGGNTGLTLRGNVISKPGYYGVYIGREKPELTNSNTVLEGNTITGAKLYAMYVDNTSIKNGEKVVVKDGNKFENNGADFSKNALVDDQRKADVPGKTDKPSGDNGNNSNNANQPGANNNAEGAKAPNTGAANVLTALVALTTVSALAISGAAYARLRAHKATASNK